MKRILPIAILFLLGCLYSNAQTPVQIDPEVAAQHLLPSRLPIYPAIARAARVMGTVVVLVVIDTNGRVADEAVQSGPPMLQGATLQGVGQFRYSPFTQDGKPVEAITALGIGFETNGGSASLPGSVYLVKKLKMDEEMKHRGDFLASYAACARQLQQGAAYSEAVVLCQDAVHKAEELPSHTSQIRAAYIDYATALLHDGKPDAATAAGNRAIAAANSNRNDVAGVSAAYTVTGEALAVTGNLREADADLSTAEKNAHRTISATPAHSPWREQQCQLLKSMLESHAKILDKMGNQKEAEKKRKEAAKLH